MQRTVKHTFLYWRLCLSLRTCILNGRSIKATAPKKKILLKFMTLALQISPMIEGREIEAQKMQSCLVIQMTATIFAFLLRWVSHLHEYVPSLCLWMRCKCIFSDVKSCIIRYAHIACIHSDLFCLLYEQLAVIKKSNVQIREHSMYLSKVFHVMCVSARN